MHARLAPIPVARGRRRNRNLHRWRLVEDSTPSGGSDPPVNEARCSNKLLEHLDHLRETKDLFGNLAKSKSEAVPAGLRFRGETELGL